ncbi:MAG TPA: hypothetical protein VHS53_05115 [Mucilaginibacter sp.]|jgi:hypothetical protein|nr:hypothetical protein [Mucilaginibacter sp.]
MHPQITAAIKNSVPYNPMPDRISQYNAERVLTYIDDLNLERHIRFRPTSAGSLFMAWTVGDWEYDMECVKNGYIVYMFTKNGYEKASGCVLFDDFIPQFEKYLLMLEMA